MAMTPEEKAALKALRERAARHGYGVRCIGSRRAMRPITDEDRKLYPELKPNWTHIYDGKQNEFELVAVKPRPSAVSSHYGTIEGLNHVLKLAERGQAVGLATACGIPIFETSANQFNKRTGRYEPARN